MESPIVACAAVFFFAEDDFLHFTALRQPAVAKLTALVAASLLETPPAFHGGDTQGLFRAYQISADFFHTAWLLQS
jgi:hypothetical protein